MKRTPQTLRLAEGQAEALTQLSIRFKTSQAQLARWAIEALIASVEESGGELRLPFKIEGKEVK